MSWLVRLKSPCQRMIDFTNKVSYDIPKKHPMFLERLQLKWAGFPGFLTQILRRELY
jgi:hypothetical protein